MVADFQQATPVITACDFKPCAPGDWGAVISAYVSEKGLKQTQTYIVFHQEFYELMLIDAPEVPDEELNEAVKWRVKDFISGSVEDYVVEAFRLPSDAYRGRMNMIYVAFIKKDAVLSLVELCEEVDLRLEEIGVSELALAKLLQDRDELTDMGIAFLHMEETKGQIDLYENGYLYLSRGIDTGYSMLNAGQSTDTLSLDNSSQLDSLALDIQRSLDYYESQLGKSGVSKLLLLSATRIDEGICSALSEKLPVEVEVFELDSVCRCEQDCSEFMDSCALAFGATLGRQDVAA